MTHSHRFEDFLLIEQQRGAAAERRHQQREHGRDGGLGDEDWPEDARPEELGRGADEERADASAKNDK